MSVALLWPVYTIILSLFVVLLNGIENNIFLNEYKFNF